MYDVMNTEKSKKLAVATSITFLFVHLFMFFMFRRYGVTPMMYFNIGSIIFYALMIWVVKKAWFRIYVLGLYIEVVVHMLLAIIFTGWESGFQVTLIGIGIILFYSEYLSRYLRNLYVHSFPTCLIAPGVYIFSYIWIRYHPPRYPLPPEVAFVFQIFLGIIVFVVTLSVLYIFVEVCMKSENYLENEVGHDQLTGLYNRYYFAEALSNVENLKQENKEQDESESAFLQTFDEERAKDYWVAMMDIDDFKNINDTYGHNCGDFILKKVAKVVLEWKKECKVRNEIGFIDNAKAARGVAEKEISIGRWGGEEFLIVGRGKESAAEMLEVLRQKIERYEFLYQKEDGKAPERVVVTVTIGLANYKKGMNAQEWIEDADNKLYVGKTSGKNKVVV
ncbi:MAG: GGDEF domain-containing protein [Eubacterium sp.]|nr:GGDEF domain-containing protein [Eubacterium sp.]